MNITMNLKIEIKNIFCKKNGSLLSLSSTSQTKAIPKNENPLKAKFYNTEKIQSLNPATLGIKFPLLTDKWHL